MTQNIQDTLFQLFESVRTDPNTFPPIPLDNWQEGSEERRLLDGFRDMMEQVQQRIHLLKQSEEQLREQEELYHSAFDVTHDGLLIGKLDGTIVEVNPAACEMYRYTHEEMIGLTGFHLIHPDSYPQLEERMAKSPSQGTRWQLMALRKDGSTFHSEGYVSTFTYKGKPHLLSIGRDVTERVRAEEQLREKGEQYRAIFEAATDGLAIVDLESGRIVEANPAQCQMHGYSYEEMIGMLPGATVHPDYLYLVEEALQKFQTEGRFQAQGVAVRKDGTTFHFSAHLTPFLYKGKPHILSATRDITERVEAERQLREREEQYRSIFETTYDGLVITNLENGCYVEVNPAFCRIFGYTREELIGMHSSVLAAPVDHHLVDEVLETLKTGQDYQTVVGQGLRKDGTRFYMEAQGTTFTYRGKPHSLSVVRDITERIEAEKQLREREEQYRSIFEETSDGLVVFDMNGFIVEANPAACHIYRCTYEELIGLHSSTLTHTDYLTMMTDAFQTVQAGGQFQKPALALHKDGTPFYGEGHATPFTFKGRPHMLVVVRDVTERVEAEKQLREREEQYRGIYEATGDGLIIADLQGVIVEANPAACRIYGYAYEELLGLSPTALTHPDSLAQVIADIQTIHDGSHVQTRPIGLRKDGSPFYAEAHGTQFTYKGRPHALAVVRDVTTQVQAEQQVREKEEQYRSVFEATYDALFIMDLDGFLVEVNPAFCHMFGYSYEEVIGLHSSAFAAPVSLPNLVESLKMLKTGTGIQTQIGQGVRKDGTAFYNEAYSSPFTYRGKPHSLGVVRDITERIEAEQQLREREALYRGIFEATSDALVIIDVEGYYVEANPAACQSFGYTREELIGQHVSARSATKSFTAQALETLKIGESYSHSYLKGAPPSWGLRKDGSVFPFDAHGSPIIYRGQPHSLIVGRDITEQVQAQQLLEQRVEERTRELSSLLEISHTVASTLYLKQLVGLILDQLRTVVDYTGAAIFTLEGDDLLLLDNRSPTAEEQLRQIRLLPQRMGPIWETISSRQTLLLSDMRDESSLTQALRTGMSGLMDTTFSYVRAGLFVPMTLKDRVIGMMALTSHEVDAFTQHHATLAQAIANQAAVAIENARLYAQAQELAALEERQKLARELHDSVSQALYGISLGAHAARTALQRDPEHVAEPLDYVLTLAEAALAEMRALIFELRPESLETEELVAALTKQAAAIQARHELVVSTDLCDEPQVSLHAKQELYRIAQEAMHNTVKHAHASHVLLHLAQSIEGILLEVQDDGTGFDAAASFPGHLGLHSMRERATNLGGTLEIESTPGTGTRIRVRVPVYAQESWSNS